MGTCRASSITESYDGESSIPFWINFSPKNPQRGHKEIWIYANYIFDNNPIKKNNCNKNSPATVWFWILLSFACGCRLPIWIWTCAILLNKFHINQSQSRGEMKAPSQRELVVPVWELAGALLKGCAWNLG